MASQIIHAFEGWHALARALPTLSAQLNEDERTWFFLGCQGPDIFYHSQRTAPYGIYYGGLLHRSHYGRFAVQLLETLWGYPLQAPEMLFALGFASHGWLDTITHPYIIYHAGWYDPKKPETKRLRYAHTFLERILDTLYWEEQTHTPVSAFMQSSCFIPSCLLQSVLDKEATVYNEQTSSAWNCHENEHINTLCDALFQAFTHTYRERFLKFSQGNTRIHNAFHDAFHVLLKTDPTRIALLPPEQKRIPLPDAGKAMLFPPNPSRDTDWQNLAHASWNNPCNAEHVYSASWNELLETARNKNISMYTGIYVWYCRKHEGNHEHEPELPLNLFPPGTLNVGDKTGKQKPPHCAAPLPVWTELERFSLENY